MVSIFIIKLKLYFIEIVCIIQNEAQWLQCLPLSDDERKKGDKGCANSEAYPDSETYHHATYRNRPTILRIISV